MLELLPRPLSLGDAVFLTDSEGTDRHDLSQLVVYSDKCVLCALWCTEDKKMCVTIFFFGPLSERLSRNFALMRAGHWRSALIAFVVGHHAR